MTTHACKEGSEKVLGRVLGKGFSEQFLEVGDSQRGGQKVSCDFFSELQTRDRICAAPFE